MPDDFDPDAEAKENLDAEPAEVEDDSDCPMCGKSPEECFCDEELEDIIKDDDV